MKQMVKQTEIKSIKNAPEEEYYTSGHRTCQGCGPALTMKLMAKAAGPGSVAIGATGCMYVANTSYYTTPWAIPWIHTQLGAIGSAVTGTSAAYRALMRKGKMKKEKINVIGIGGDGGAMDIGLSALSGAMSLDYDFLIVLYDNESYANTGIQASSLTPWGAWTTFTPPGKKSRIGNKRWKKDAAKLIAAGHPHAYIATATLSQPVDFMKKVRKALEYEGPALIHVLAPCPKGWKFEPSKTIEVSRQAIRTGTWMLYEIEGGKFRLTYRPKERKPVENYIRLQGRFSHLTEQDIKYIQERVDAAWRDLAE